MDFYKRVYEEVLAIPVIKGIKTEVEKFPGGFYTTSVETWVPINGRSIQAATSHQLGQNFSKMFDITFEDKNQKSQHAWQTSWGLSTRSIGVLILMHGDDKGLVLPPAVSQYQVVIVPIYIEGKVDHKELIKSCEEIKQKLVAANLRVFLDDRDNYSPGWKFNQWELRGVPLRLEVGPKDFNKKEARAVRRFDEVDK